jgi:1-acyl-sn-glycerol-3-phosphate acyltransferase
MDVTYLLARMPEAVCIFKPAIARNPVLGAAARRAGYLPGGGGVDLIRQVAEKAAAGHRVIIFPEGTRTSPGETVLPLKPGFVLMAQRGRVPIQLVRIVWNSNVLAKGRAWWKLPRLPAQIDVTLGPLVTVDSDASPTKVAARIEAWFRSPSAVAFATPGVVFPASCLPNPS